MDKENKSPEDSENKPVSHEQEPLVSGIVPTDINKSSDDEAKRKKELLKNTVASKPSKDFGEHRKKSDADKSNGQTDKIEDKSYKTPNEFEEDFQEYYVGDSGRAFIDTKDLDDATKTKASFTAILRFLGVYARKLISLDDDKANEQQTIDQIKRNVVFRGTNIWILIFAILVASVGLNMNSAAVVIGAMLISPLMGPIMGLGLGVGINDLELIKKSAKNLLVMAFISILASAAYFLITPISDAHSELLARTTPTIFDVLIAFFGGMAGIVAGSRSEKSNAIPGVAIATALMPPLCTAGYGIANGNWEYFSGALYLFFINSVFIAISTFVIVRYLRYPRKKFADDAIEKKVKMYVVIIALATLVPSIYFAYNVVMKSFFVRNASEFVRNEMNFENTYIIDTEYFAETDSTAIQVTLYGEPITEKEIRSVKKKMPAYDLPENCELFIRQSVNDNGLTADDVNRINSQIREDLMRDLFRNNEEQLADREATISKLQDELLQLRQPMLLSEDLLEEINVNYTNLERFSVSKATIYNSPEGDQASDSTFKLMDTILIAYARFDGRPPRKRERQKLEEWLRVRTKDSTLKLIVE